MADFTESIHVELTDKGREVIMLEVFGEDNVSESINILNIKGVSCGNPLDILCTTFILILESISTSRILLNF